MQVTRLHGLYPLVAELRFELLCFKPPALGPYKIRGWLRVVLHSRLRLTEKWGDRARLGWAAAVMAAVI
jgi:hypothetical protein